MSNIAQEESRLGRTRWRRFGLAAGAGFGAVGIVGYLAATGALALSFAFSGIPFTLSADSLNGEHFVQYAVPDAVASNHASQLENGAAKVVNAANPIDNTLTLPNGQTYVSDTVTQLRTATIGGLRQQICGDTPIPGKGIRVTIMGTGDTTASNLVIQAPALTATSANFNNIVIGESVESALNGQGFGAGDFTDPYKALSGNTALAGSFGQGADSVALSNIDQVGIGTEAGSFNIGGLKLWAEFVNGC